MAKIKLGNIADNSLSIKLGGSVILQKRRKQIL
jgi:hypothetical protein